MVSIFKILLGCLAIQHLVHSVTGVETREVNSMVELKAAVEDVAVDQVVVRSDIFFTLEWPVTGMGIRGPKQIRGDSQACGGACVLDLQGGEDVARRLLYVEDQGFLTLSNLVIRNGRVYEWTALEATDEETRAGGAVLIYDGSANFLDITFEDNMALSTSNTWGGAVGIVNSNGKARFENCLFSKNVAGEGGAVLLKGRSRQENVAEFINCTFDENNAPTTGGGAVSIGYKSEAIFTNCLFKYNQAVTGNAIYLTSFGVAKMWDCTFEDQGVTPIKVEQSELYTFPFDPSIASADAGSTVEEYVIPPPPPPSPLPPPLPLVLPATNAPTSLPPPTPPVLPSSEGSSTMNTTVVIGVAAVFCAIVLTLVILLVCRRRRAKKEMHVTAHAQRTYGVMSSAHSGGAGHAQMAVAMPPHQGPNRPSAEDSNLFGGTEALQQRASTFASMGTGRLSPLPEQSGYSPTPAGRQHVEREARDELRSLASPWGAHQAYAGRTASDIAQDMDYWNHLAAGRSGANTAGGESNLAYLGGPWGPSGASGEGLPPEAIPSPTKPLAPIPPPIPPPQHRASAQQRMGGISEEDTWSDLAQRGRDHTGNSGRQPASLAPRSGHQAGEIPESELVADDDQGDEMM